MGSLFMKIHCFCNIYPIMIFLIFERWFAWSLLLSFEAFVAHISGRVSYTRWLISAGTYGTHSNEDPTLNNQRLSTVSNSLRISKF